MDEPIVHSVVVAAAPERAFEVFTEDFGRWWDPRLTAAPHTFGTVDVPREPGQDVVFEPTPAGAETRVTLTQDGWTAGNIAERKKYTEWPELLRRYAECVEEPRATG